MAVDYCLPGIACFSVESDHLLFASLGHNGFDLVETADITAVMPVVVGEYGGVGCQFCHQGVGYGFGEPSVVFTALVGALLIGKMRYDFAEFVADEFIDRTSSRLTYAADALVTALYDGYVAPDVA